MRRSPGGLEVSSGRDQELGDRTAPSRSLTPQTVLSRVGRGRRTDRNGKGNLQGAQLENFQRTGASRQRP